MQIILVVFITITMAFKSCSIPPKLPDGTIVPISVTEHNHFSTPDCAGLDLEFRTDLKCIDGSFFVVDPEGERKVLANKVNFCSDPAHPVAENKETYDKEFLPAFWKFFKNSHDKTSMGCPEEALECYNFDDFENLYVPGRNYEADKAFIRDIPLDNPSYLEYDFYVDEYVREFSFANGLLGRVIEFKEDGKYKIYATINSEGDEHLTLYIKPCDVEEGETCKYVMYLQDRTIGTVEEEKLTEQFNEKEDLQRRMNKKEDDEMIHARLQKVDSKRRRSLTISNIVSITFMYDPQIQSSSDAKSKSVSTILDFNKALASHSTSVFRLLLRTVADMPRNTFNSDHGSCCACASSNIMNACKRAANGLPSHKKADLFHCWVSKHSFAGSVVGCGGSGNVGVTILGRSDSVAIAMHELGHQMGAPHKEDCWCANRFIFCLDTDCSLMNPTINNVVKRFHSSSITEMNKQKGYGNRYNHLNEGGCYQDSQKRLFKKWDILGFNTHQKTVTNTARECAERCNGVADCIGSSWFSNKSCYLAGPGAKLVSGSGVTSYTCSRNGDNNCVTNQKHGGGTVVNGNAGAADAASCQTKCLLNIQCQYWDFHNNVCRLLSSSGLTSSSGAVAGTVDCMGADQTYRNIQSARSGKGDDNETRATCPTGFILTDCECYSPWYSCDGARPRDSRTCSAFNKGGGEGVYARARCMKIPGFSNWHHVSGSRSGNSDDSPSYATCPSGYKLTGCSCHSPWKSCDGAKFSGNSCIAYNKRGGSGVYAKAICGKFSNTGSRIVMSGRSGKSDDAPVTATCPSGYSLTGCTCHSPWLSCDGAKHVDDNKCTAYNKNGGDGVYASAQCHKF